MTITLYKYNTLYPYIQTINQQFYLPLGNSADFADESIEIENKVSHFRSHRTGIATFAPQTHPYSPIRDL